MLRRRLSPRSSAPESPSVLRQKNMQTRVSEEQESLLQPKEEGESRKRKLPGLVSPGSTENKPDGGTGNPAVVKKKKLGQNQPGLQLQASSSHSYAEDVHQFSEVDDDEEHADAESVETDLSVLSRSSSGNQRTGLALKTKRQRRELVEETPGQKAARKLLKRNDAIARREARKSLKVFQGQDAEVEIEAAPRPNAALAYFIQRAEGKGGEKCSGIIKRVKLFNFMCHESFDKEWHPNLNFITGQNGSGKSAVLSGILIGLGARATSTSRTKSIKGLVKTGKEFCKTEITLINNGILSEKYGKEIMIQRVIDNNGISNYKIDDGKTRMRMLRRVELDTLLVTLGIMLDNPVAVLNQETARSFLRTKDPRDKYHLFYEGTSLGKCKRVLDETLDNIEATKVNFQKCRELLEIQKEDMKKLKKTMAKFLELDRMGDQIDVLTTQYHWALVIADEQVQDKLKREAAQDEAAQTSIQTHFNALVEKKDALLQETGLSPEDEAEVKNQLRDLGRRDKEAQLETSKLSREMANAKVQIRNAVTHIATQKKVSEKLAEKIEEMRTVGVMQAESAQRDFQEKQSELLQEEANAEQEATTARQDSEQFKHGADTLKAELNELEDRDRQLIFGLDRHKKELQALRSNGAKLNKYEAYGRPMVELVAKIQANNHRFRKPPRGPLGTCFTVKDEKWVRLVEFILKDKLYDFVVDNAEDLKLLNEFIKQTFMRGPSGTQVRKVPAVVVSKYCAKAFDVSRTRATTPKHPTILDSIEIENNDFIVSNALIDTASIEKILLIETDREALDLLKYSSNPEFPKTCKQAFTLENSRITPDPKFRIDPLHRQARELSLLKCSSQAQLRALERLIEEAQLERQDMTPTLESKRREEAEYREQYLKLVQVYRQSQKKIGLIKVRLANLAKTIVRAPDVSSFVEELNETNDRVARFEAEDVDARSRLSVIQPQLIALKAEREEVTNTIATLQQQLMDFQERTEKYHSKLEKLEQAIRKTKAQLRDAVLKCESLIPKLAKIEEFIRKRMAEAETHGPRVATNRTPESLQQEYKEYSKRLEEAKRDVGDRTKVAISLKTAKRRYIQTNTQYLIWYNIFHMVVHSMNVKRAFFDNSVRSIGQHLCACFHSLIGYRGYKGKILIDDHNKELFYFVCPDGQADAKTKAALESNSDKVIKQYLIEYASGLSGGERSFATICFIISMWQVMECPFFMLDEFDVFMDPFNRKTSQNALISHAKNYKAHQFFLFTPLELTEMPTAGDATVLRMFPPIRKSMGNTPSSVVAESDEELGDDIETPQPGPSRRAPKRRL